MPNVVAVDFAYRGDLMETVAEMNEALRGQVRSARRSTRAGSPGAATDHPAPR